MDEFYSASCVVIDTECATSQADAGMPAPLAGAITSLESLREYLQWAIELAHSTIYPYLCALYSIQPGRTALAWRIFDGAFVAHPSLHTAYGVSGLRAPLSR
jgi:hypothetical protein